MPSKYSDQQKREAVEMLEIADDIAFVHDSTGIPKRTLRRWRQNLRQDPNGQTAEKTFNSSAGQSTIPAKTDIEDFTYIRGQLMKYARQMASDLRPGDVESNRRTLALSRVLDRIQQLDQVLPEKAKQQARPPWQDDFESLLELDLSPWDLIKVQQTASQVDEHLRGRVYRYYAEQHRTKAARSVSYSDILNRR